MDKPWTTEPDTDKPSENLPSWGPLDRNPAYDGPMGIFEGYGEYDDAEDSSDV